MKQTENIKAAEPARVLTKIRAPNPTLRIEHLVRSYRNGLPLLLILIGFLIIQCCLPLQTAVQIGADEGYDLAKAVLILNGYHLYTDIWNDQPPLYTFLVTQTVKYSDSILGPRLITTAFTVLLLISVYCISLRTSGLAVAILATAFLIASPGFVELSSSCMVEIPALAPAVAALCLLISTGRRKWPLGEILAGIAFGIAFQNKLLNMILLPLAALIVWHQHSSDCKGMHRARNVLTGLVALGISTALSFVVIDLLVDQGTFLLHFQQSWSAHFASGRSFEYGSASEHPFQWIILLKNWEILAPAVAGIALWGHRFRKPALPLLPFAWLALALVVFTNYKPWWQYYYIHVALPLCWCAAVGLIEVYRRARLGGKRMLLLLAAVYVLGAASWMGARIYLQVRSIRNSNQLYHSLVLKEIERLKPFTKWIYVDQLIYTFHARIPVPPQFAVVSLKRLWSGDMTNERIAADLWNIQPGLILMANTTRNPPFKELLDARYRLIYRDEDHALYAHSDVIRMAKERDRSAP
jgi:4-amino-4-deoxy-L-arabinose transferase-like glycosyltransferase